MPRIKSSSALWFSYRGFVCPGSSALPLCPRTLVPGPRQGSQAGKPEGPLPPETEQRIGTLTSIRGAERSGDNRRLAPLLVSLVWGGAWERAFLASPGDAMLPALGPHMENHWSRRVVSSLQRGGTVPISS